MAKKQLYVNFNQSFLETVDKKTLKEIRIFTIVNFPVPLLCSLVDLAHFITFFLTKTFEYCQKNCYVRLAIDWFECRDC